MVFRLLFLGYCIKVKNKYTVKTLKTILGVVVAIIILTISIDEIKDISFKELFQRNNVIHDYEMINPVAYKTN